MPGGQQFLSPTSKGTCKLPVPHCSQTPVALQTSSERGPGLTCKHPGGPQTSSRHGERAQQTVSVKSQGVNSLGFVSCMFSAATIQFCHCSPQNSHRQVNTWMRSYTNKIQKQVAGWVWPSSSKSPGYWLRILRFGVFLSPSLSVPTWGEGGHIRFMCWHCRFLLDRKPHGNRSPVLSFWACSLPSMNKGLCTKGMPQFPVPSPVFVNLNLMPASFIYLKHGMIRNRVAK